jgi:N-acetyl-anhydromuramyl-L-alanine amidase AmpD
MRLFGIAAERIVGHRTFNPGKTCPGARFDLEAVRRMVR